MSLFLINIYIIGGKQIANSPVSQNQEQEDPEQNDELKHTNGHQFKGRYAGMYSVQKKVF